MQTTPIQEAPHFTSSLFQRGSVVAALIALLLGAFSAQAATDSYTASGTWTAPAGVSSVDVEVWGGGGAGGGNQTNSDGGGGGGGGAYSKTTAIPVTPGNVYTVTVGAGGIGGTGTGGTGGDSWFINATTIRAKGGTGGAAPVGGNGGVAGVGGSAAAGIGITKFSGGNGGTGRNNNTGRGGPGGSSAGTAAAGTSGLVVWNGTIAAAPPAGGGIGGNGGDADRQNGYAPASGNGGGGGGGAERNTIGGNGTPGKVALTYTAAPSVVSINTGSTNPTSPNTSVSWTIIFDQGVTGVDTTDFTLVQSGGAAGASITSVSGSGTTWTVTANTGTGTSGTLGLNLVDNDTIVGSSGKPLGGTGTGNGNFTGQIYTIAPPISALATYRMDEAGWNGTASEVADSSGNGYNAQSFNSATTDGATPAIGGSPGTCRYGVFDDGTTTINSGYVQTPLPNLTTNFTVTAWVRTTDNTIPGQRILIDDQNNTGGYGISLGDGGTGRIRFYSRGIAPVILDSTVTLANNTWYFMAVVTDITNRIRTIYVFDTGGTLLGSTSDPTPFTGTWGTDAGPVSIGGETNASTETPASSHFRGNIDEVQVFNAALSQAQAALIAARTHPCTGFDHVLINAPASAMALSDVQITIEPHTSTHTAIPNAGTILLNTSTGQGDWSIGTGTGTLTPGPANSGQASYTFGMTESTVTLDLAYPAADTVTISVVENASSANLLLNTPPSELANTISFTAPSFVFTDSACQDGVAFGTVGQCALVSWSPQVAGIDLANVYITNVDGAGVPTRLSRTRTRTRDMDFGLSCNDPVGNAGMRAVFAGVVLPLCEANGAQPATWSAAVTATFPAGEPSAGPFTFNYPDVGQVNLWMRNTASTGQIGSSNPFVVAPHHFGISGVTAAPIKAGNNFSATVTAYNGLSTPGVTANFGQETSAESVTLSFSRCQPTGAGASDGTFTGNVGAFGGGAATSGNLNWNEVGNGDLVATNSNYLGSGLTVTGNSGTGGTVCNTGGAGNVGPFIPDHLDTTVSGGMPCPSELTCPAPYNGFSYSGQPFTVNVYAQNAGGGTTTNYDGTANTAPNFAKAVTLSAWDAQGGSTAAASGTLNNITVAAAAFNSGTTVLGTPAAPDFAFSATPTAPTDIYLRAIDSGNVSSLRGLASIEGGIKVVSGRVKVSNAYGSELLPLTLNATTQYFNTSNVWTDSDTDSLTSLVLAASYPVINNGTPTGSTIPLPTGSATVSGGILGIILSSPGSGGIGNATVSPGTVYLPVTPGRATFGVYRGNKDLIYMREQH